MALPFSYNVRNAGVRWRLTMLAVGGIAVVVAVFAVLMAMSEGFTSALRASGREDNAIIVQRGAHSEVTSEVPLEDRKTILGDDRLARGPDGQVLGSWETVRSLRLIRADGRRASVTLRAVPPQAFEVRGGIRVIEGRRFTPGLREVIVGRRIMTRVRDLRLGGPLGDRRHPFTIVGIFESEGAAFESEVWGDFDAVRGASGQGPRSNSLVVRMKDPSQIAALDQWIRTRPGMQLRAIPERQYWADQAGPLATTLKGLAALVALVMGVGAVFGTMNTMYAIVAARTREVGTLRAVGFSRGAILSSVVAESACLALVGGGLGCVLALFTHGLATSTSNLQTLSEIAFAFRVTPMIVGLSLAFAVLMGVLGGLLPALRAARLPIAAALREG
jgi:putative ABC transport system permease protein